MEIAETEQHQWNYRGEQQDRNQNTERAAVNLDEPLQDRHGRTQLSCLGQTPIALLKAVPNVSGVVFCAHRGSLSENTS